MGRFYLVLALWFLCFGFHFWKALVLSWQLYRQFSFGLKGLARLCPGCKGGILVKVLQDNLQTCEYGQPGALKIAITYANSNTSVIFVLKNSQIYLDSCFVNAGYQLLLERQGWGRFHWVSCLLADIGSNPVTIYLFVRYTSVLGTIKNCLGEVFTTLVPTLIN